MKKLVLFPIILGCCFLSTERFLNSEMIKDAIKDKVQVKVKWKFKALEKIWGGAAIGSDGTIYVGCDRRYHVHPGILYALHPNGTLKWKTRFPCDSIDTTPSIGRNGTIFFGDAGSGMYALNPNGTCKWEYPIPCGTDVSQGIASDGTLYVPYGRDYADVYWGRLLALSPDGKKKWEYESLLPIRSAPVIGGDGTIYFGAGRFATNTSRLIALNPDGSLKWKIGLQSGITDSTPAIGSDGTIYIGTGVGCGKKGYLYSVNPDGTVNWKFNITKYSSSFHSAPVIGKSGTIYFGTWGSMIFALNPDGSLKWLWKYDHVGSTFGAPVLGSDETIYFSGNNFIYALNSKGEKQWEFNAGGEIRGHLTMSKDGVLIFGTFGGYVYALSLDSGGLQNSPWPKFQNNRKNTGRIQ